MFGYNYTEKEQEQMEKEFIDDANKELKNKGIMVYHLIRHCSYWITVIDIKTQKSFGFTSGIVHPHSSMYPINLIEREKDVFEEIIKKVEKERRELKENPNLLCYTDLTEMGKKYIKT